MKKTIAVLLALIFAFSLSTMAFADEAETAIVVTIDGFAVNAPAGVKVIFADANGNVTANPENATEVQLRATGDIVVNGELFTAGANGKVNVQLNLPITKAPNEEPAVEPEEPAAEPKEFKAAPTAAEKTEPEEPEADPEELIGTPDIVPEVTATFLTALWGRVWAYISSMFSFFKLF